MKGVSDDMALVMVILLVVAVCFGISYFINKWKKRS